MATICWDLHSRYFANILWFDPDNMIISPQCSCNLQTSSGSLGLFSALPSFPFCVFFLSGASWWPPRGVLFEPLTQRMWSFHSLCSWKEGNKKNGPVRDKQFDETEGEEMACLAHSEKDLFSEAEENQGKNCSGGQSVLGPQVGG